MKRSNFKIFFFLIFFVFIKYQSQITTIEKQIQNIASPEIASIMKYSDFPQLDYIGKTNITVPIYEIKFGKLQIPINLSYNTKGNKVADIATSVGLGWNLNASGNLTLKVNDMNDLIETYSYYTTATFEPEQSLAWHRQSKGYLNIQTPQVDNLCITNRIWENDDAYVDSAPDFYYVNAPGLNDKFYFTRLNDTTLRAHFFSTKAKLNNSPNLTQEISCKTLEGFLGYGGSATVFYRMDKFEITGENGYIYTYNKPESSIINDYTTNYYSHNSKQINNWYLTNIKDPATNKEIAFEYEYYSNPYEHLTLRTDGYLNFGNFPVANNYELGTAGTNNVPNQPVNRVTGSILIPCRLKKIVSNEETVEFSYAQTRLDYPGSALSSIYVKNKNSDIIKQVDFGYDYFESQNCSMGNYECKRLKLSSINDSSLGVYRFYYDNNSFPARNSSKVDFLGYYNNNDSDITFTKTNFHEFNYYYPGTKIYFYPTLLKDQLLPFELVNKVAYAITPGVDRSAKTISKLGLLERIVYPTGGSLKLNYENDDFMYEGAKYILGSTRISNMKFFVSNNIVSKEVNYKYLNEDGTSSGQINFLTPPSNIGKTEIASGIGFNTGAVIGYSRIIEEVVGKGYIEKKYSNFSNYSDKLMTSDYAFTDQGTINFLKFLKFPSSYVQSFDERRGKLITENYYKEGQNFPMKRNSYEYNYLVKDSLKVKKDFTSYNSAFYPSGNYKASNYIFTYFNNLTKKTEEDFFASNAIVTENSFDYDDARLIYKKTVASGNTTEEYYRNAKDKSIQKLINSNILDLPIEIEKKINGKIVSKQEVKYESSIDLFPSSQYLYNLNTTSMEKEISYDKYDSQGNLLQYTLRNGIPTTIIWGYRQSQPIVKIEGANYSQIMQAFSLNTNDNNAYLNLEIVKKSNLHFDTSTETDLFSKLNEFRNNPQLKEFKVTTYTHAPLIGVKSITPASGLKEKYVYDTSNRLEKVINSDNKISKEYKYNYTPATYYSAVKTQLFTRNNCGSSAIGGSYIYTVPAGQYTSTMSQLDADQKALDDINSNGQNAANSNGTCTSISCPLSFNSALGIGGGGSVTATPTSYYKVSFGFSSGSNSTNLPWNTGVKVATISGICKPTTEYSSYNGQVYYTIKTNGEIILRTNGTILANNTSYNYEIFFPIN
ncbi:DUF5977 domain-containing protein [Chryseobacterium sp. CCH4-E10]|uniref:DUF5977 domain-containing protein n=1 Tax=Chryseobacterium sp. CCH4-E10 TaxID=1768758 RepID=UPI00082C290F|nr:DUF5977 domain-containing protein [Chryseobacterium sp. CCH4-E10]